MQVPDHYKTLQVSPMASPQEIKKAYRKLALQFHPDKTQDDPWALAHFAAIKEAYETLSNPWKKQQYLEARWYTKSQGVETGTVIRTPASILQEALRIDRESAMADVFRMDKAALQEEMHQLLNTANMDCLQQFGELAVNRQIVQILCRPLQLLTPVQARKLHSRLTILAGEDEQSMTLIRSAEKLVRRNHNRQRFQWIWIPVAIIILYLLIRFTGA